MSKIKTRKNAKDIKILDRSAVVGQRMKNAYIRSKRSAAALADDRQATPNEYAENNIELAADDFSHDAANVVVSGTKSTVRQGQKLFQRQREKKAKEKRQENDPPIEQSPATEPLPDAAPESQSPQRYNEPEPAGRLPQQYTDRSPEGKLPQQRTDRIPEGKLPQQRVGESPGPKSPQRRTDKTPEGWFFQQRTESPTDGQLPQRDTNPIPDRRLPRQRTSTALDGKLPQKYSGSVSEVRPPQQHTDAPISVQAPGQYADPVPDRQLPRQQSSRLPENQRPTKYRSAADHKLPSAQAETERPTDPISSIVEQGRAFVKKQAEKWAERKRQRKSQSVQADRPPQQSSPQATPQSVMKAPHQGEPITNAQETPIKMVKQTSPTMGQTVKVTGKGAKNTIRDGRRTVKTAQNTILPSGQLHPDLENNAAFVKHINGGGAAQCGQVGPKVHRAAADALKEDSERLNRDFWEGQTKGRTVASSRDVVTISAQAKEAIAKQESRANSAAPVSAVSERQIDVIGSTFTSFAKEFSKITGDYADTIREYYATEHEENLTYDDPSNHVWDKYKNPKSPYFRSDLSEDERAWAYDYEQELLRGGKHLQIHNPYTFADAGGPPTLADAAMRAIQACREQIDQSIQDIFAENGIEVPASFQLTVDPSDYSIHVTGLEDEELANTIEQALNQGDNGKNLYDYLKLTSPGSGKLDVAFEDGHLPTVDPQQELNDETLAEIRNQTSPAWARYNDYDPHKGPLGTMTNPLGDIERTPEEEERINSGIRMSAPEVIAQFKAMPQQTLEMSWWEKFGEEIGMSGDEVFQIAKDTYYHTYVQRMIDRRETIETYYADAHAETLAHANAMALKNHSDPFMEALDYIAQKYLWSPDLQLLNLNQPEYFRWDMGEEERRIAYDQERRLLFGLPVTLNDPYALASVGGVPYVKDEEEIAKQAVRDKLDELRKQAQGGELV